MAFKGEKETLEQREAFDYYYLLGGDRSCTAVAPKFKKSLKTIKNWSKKFNWRERVQQRDMEIARELEKKTNESIIDEKAKYRDDIKSNVDIIRYTLNKINDKINNFKVIQAQNEKLEQGEEIHEKEVLRIDTIENYSNLIRAFERLVKLDLLLMGEPNARYQPETETPKTFLDWLNAIDMAQEKSKKFYKL